MALIKLGCKYCGILKIYPYDKIHLPPNYFCSKKCFDCSNLINHNRYGVLKENEDLSIEANDSRKDSYCRPIDTKSEWYKIFVEPKLKRKNNDSSSNECK